MLRVLDFTLSIIGILICLPIILTLLIICYIDTGSPIFLQQRIGENLKPFTIIKFRTMHLNTVSTGTHLVDSSHITRVGRFLRRTKLDELPQLLNILMGKMSVVGPRPCLLNQECLIRERKKRNIFSVRPGITGLAQINHVDMSTPRKLARYDQLMLKNMSNKFYFHILLNTMIGKGSGDRVR